MKTKELHIKPEGRETVRYCANGVVIYWTYPDQDPRIPEGTRKGTFLEPYKGEDE